MLVLKKKLLLLYSVLELSCKQRIIWGGEEEAGATRAFRKKADIWNSLMGMPRNLGVLERRRII